MAGSKDVKVLTFGLPGKIKNNNFLLNIPCIFTQFESPFFRQGSEVFCIHQEPPLRIY